MLETSTSNFRVTGGPPALLVRHFLSFNPSFEMKNEIKYFCSGHFEMRSYQNEGGNRNGREREKMPDFLYLSRN